MRIVTTTHTLYTVHELEELHPAGFERAWNDYTTYLDDDGGVWSEFDASLFAIQREIQGINPDDYVALADDIERRGAEYDFTGVYCDDIAKAAADAMRAGENLHVILAQVEAEAQCAYERELEALASEESFIEHAEVNEMEFYKDGERA